MSARVLAAATLSLSYKQASHTVLAWNHANSMLEAPQFDQLQRAAANVDISLACTCRPTFVVQHQDCEVIRIHPVVQGKISFDSINQGESGANCALPINGQARYAELKTVCRQEVWSGHAMMSIPRFVVADV